MIHIALDGMEFHGYHGVHQEEKKLGGKYILDVGLDARVEDACTSDDLEDTIDYEAMYARIVKAMDEPCHLLEHLAHVIARDLLAADDRIERADVTIRKIQPPMPGIIRSAAVRVVETRSERR